MNLFKLHEDHDKNAEYHVDKHIVKMILESAQILCTNLTVDHLFGFLPGMLNSEQNKILSDFRKDQKNLSQEDRLFTYLPTMQNHPSTVWARSSLENFYWTHCYAHSLAEEYRYRYGKDHKSFWDVINKLPDPKHMEDVGLTPFAMAMPEELKDYEDPVQSYRNYYMLDKATFASWKYRDKPDWWEEELADYEQRITRKQ